MLRAGLLPVEVLLFARVLLLGFFLVSCLVGDAQMVVRLPVSSGLSIFLVFFFFPL